MIKLLLVDVDGVLTDGGYYTGVDMYDPVYASIHPPSKSVLIKKFHTRDFHGMSLLNQLGVVIGIVTCSSDFVITKRMEQATYAQLHRGINDKLSFVQSFYKNFLPDEIAFIGDDVDDLPLLSYVGYPACPGDANEDVFKFVNDNGFVMNKNGGEGCVREFIDFLKNLMPNQPEEK